MLVGGYILGRLNFLAIYVCLCLQDKSSFIHSAESGDPICQLGCFKPTIELDNISEGRPWMDCN